MSATRSQLLDTAERLFLENGLDGVSLRTIVREAGQKNQSALQYHFGGRDGLLQAILDRRLLQVEETRQALLDEALTRQQNPDLREICALMARGPFLLCRERQDFREFLGLFGQQLLGSEPTISFDHPNRDLPSLKVLQSLLKRTLSPVDPELMALRVENAQSLVLLVLSRRARLGGSFRGRRAELFFNNLIDQVAAMLAGPVSDATRSLLNDAPGDSR